MFGRDLAEARVACRRYQSFGDVADLNRAWDIYYAVYWQNKEIFIEYPGSDWYVLGVQEGRETAASTYQS